MINLMMKVTTFDDESNFTFDDDDDFGTQICTF
jgi:hypothetical protein